MGGSQRMRPAHFLLLICLRQLYQKKNKEKHKTIRNLPV